MNHSDLELTVLLGAENKQWIYACVDWWEWTRPAYHHQN